MTPENDELRHCLAVLGAMIIGLAVLVFSAERVRINNLEDSTRGSVNRPYY